MIIIIINKYCLLLLFHNNNILLNEINLMKNNKTCYNKNIYNRYSNKQMSFQANQNCAFLQVVMAMPSFPHKELSAEAGLCCDATDGALLLVKGIDRGLRLPSTESLSNLSAAYIIFMRSVPSIWK